MENLRVEHGWSSYRERQKEQLHIDRCPIPTAISSAGGTMSGIWAVIQGFGALVGLATGAFVIWDRVIKEWPLAFIVREPLIPGSMNTVSKLRIVNRSPRPILISWPSGESHGFGIARDNSLREVVAATLPGELTHVIDGNETVELPLFAPSHLNEIASDNTIDIDLRWSFVQPVIWQRPRKLSVRVTKKAYMALLGQIDREE